LFLIKNIKKYESLK